MVGIGVSVVIIRFRHKISVLSMFASIEILQLVVMVGG